MQKRFRDVRAPVIYRSGNLGDVHSTTPRPFLVPLYPPIPALAQENVCEWVWPWARVLGWWLAAAAAAAASAAGAPKFKSQFLAPCDRRLTHTRWRTNNSMAFFTSLPQTESRFLSLCLFVCLSLSLSFYRYLNIRLSLAFPFLSLPFSSFRLLFHPCRCLLQFLSLIFNLHGSFFLWLILSLAVPFDWSFSVLILSDQ